MYTLRTYDPAWLRDDVVAGLVLTTMLVLVGIAYAVASGVPHLTACTRPSSRYWPTPYSGQAAFSCWGLILIGSFILAVVLPLSGGDPPRAVALASMMAVVSGVVCIIAGLARLGFITELLSKPICYGYINGIALTVLTSQLPKLAFQSKTPDRFRDLWAIAKSVLGGAANWVTFFNRCGYARNHLGLKGNKKFPGI